MESLCPTGKAIAPFPSFYFIYCFPLTVSSAQPSFIATVRAVLISGLSLHSTALHAEVLLSTFLGIFRSYSPTKKMPNLGLEDFPIAFPAGFAILLPSTPGPLHLQHPQNLAGA